MSRNCLVWKKAVNRCRTWPQSFIFLFLLFSAFLQGINLLFSTSITGEELPKYPNLKSSPFSSPSALTYLIHPETIESECKRGRLWLLIIVHSAISHLAQRNAIRKTWGSVTGLDDKQIRSVFLLGKPTQFSENEKILLESRQYGDILQGDFLDTYRNLTYKNLMGLKWVSESCEGLQFVWKSDDDVFLNLYGIYSLIKERYTELKDSTMACLASKRSRVHRTGRYAVPQSVYPLQFYPEHCIGMAYLLSFNAVRSLFLLSRTAPYMSVDDAFLGIIRTKTDVRLHKLNFFYTLKKAKLLECMTKFGKNCQFYVGPADLHKMEFLWQQIQQ